MVCGEEGLSIVMGSGGKRCVTISGGVEQSKVDLEISVPIVEVNVGRLVNCYCTSVVTCYLEHCLSVGSALI